MCRIRRVDLALALVLLAPAAHAADAQTVQLPARGWGVEFGIQGASLTTFDGGTITLRHQTSEHASWRYAASFSGNALSAGRGLPFGVPPFEQESDDDHRTSFAASLTRVTCLAPTSVIRPYLGLGGGAGWITQRREATFSTFDEAMELANAHGYGLSSAIYTTSGTHAFRFRERITAGMVSVNNSTSGAEAHLPFGGNGLSGNGSRQSGVWVLDQFTRWQSMNWDYAGKLQKAQMDMVELPAAELDFRLED